MCINKDNSRNRINRLSCLRRKTTHSLFAFISWMRLKCIFIQYVKIVRVQSSCNLFREKNKRFSSKKYFELCKKNNKELNLSNTFVFHIFYLYRKLQSFLSNFFMSYATAKLQCIQHHQYSILQCNALHA